jgi:hypothetical protein
MRAVPSLVTLAVLLGIIGSTGALRCGVPGLLLIGAGHFKTTLLPLAVSEAHNESIGTAKTAIPACVLSDDLITGLVNGFAGV